MADIIFGSGITIGAGISVTSSPLTVAGAPTIGTATATGETTATVTFTAPASDGGSTITSYTATSSPGNITGTLSQAGSGTITVNGLTASTSYTFTVTATNSIGTSSPSSASNSTTTTAPQDPYFMYNSLLLPGNGTNLAQNNTFLDGSTNNFTITRYGNTTQGTFSPYGPNWSNYFGASTSNRIRAPANAAFAFGTGAFTVEAWIYVTNLAVENFVFDTRSSVSTAGVGFSIEPNTGKLRYSGNANNVLTTTAITANTWNHVAWVYNGTTLTGYINGVSGGTVTPGFNITQNNGEIGNVPFSAVPTTGYLSNVRVVKGTAVYTGTFTPSTTPLTAIAGTSLLTCQSNRFVDNSSNAFALTVSGTPTIQRFSPFSPTAAYSAGTIGGSGYFDGTGDYLTVPDSATLEPGSSNFTIECYIYPTANGSYLGVFSKRTQNASDYSPIQLLINNGTMEMAASTTGTSWAVVVTASSSPPLNVWSHVAVVRNGTGSNNLVLYLNGTSVGSGSISNTTLVNNSAAWAIGADAAPGTGAFIGYISNFRSVIGTAVYTTTFTPPTTPLTAITNTSLLLNYTNAGIIDNAMMNNLETVGNAKISTAQSKFGGSSMLFDGTGDYLTVPTTPNLSFGTGDFTVEAWVYLTANSATGVAAYLTDFRANGSTSNFAIGFMGAAGVSKMYAWANATDLNATTTVALNTWNHVAYVRSGSTVTAYLNGTANGTMSNAYSQPSTGVAIASRYTGTTEFINGYIDDLRITKGYARYTSNFTPPTAALPTY